jgi:hypothetical protein
MLPLQDKEREHHAEVTNRIYSPNINGGTNDNLPNPVKFRAR